MQLRSCATFHKVGLAAQAHVAGLEELVHRVENDGIVRLDGCLQELPWCYLRQHGGPACARKPQSRKHLVALEKRGKDMCVTVIEALEMVRFTPGFTPLIILL